MFRPFQSRVYRLTAIESLRDALEELTCSIYGVLHWIKGLGS